MKFIKALIVLEKTKSINNSKKSYNIRQDNYCTKALHSPFFLIKVSWYDMWSNLYVCML